MKRKKYMPYYSQCIVGKMRDTTFRLKFTKQMTDAGGTVCFIYADYNFLYL